MIATSCFSREELESYLRGRIDDERSSSIETHIESCARCEDTLSELDASDDTLIRTLRVKSAGQSDSPDWISQLAKSSELEPKKPQGDLHEEQSDEVIGDYQVLHVLGHGGMSIVFAARHQHLGRDLALKVLLPSAQNHLVSRERFSREMRAVGALDHPTIVRATDAGEWNDTLYLAMEKIDGVDLKRISRIEGPLRVADACAICSEIARGLAYAHEQGIVHRDIKPSNVMLDVSGNVKILDFGFARLQSASSDVSRQTTVGQLLGTLDFMAPEQASGTEVDCRADIYALGATLFKLLTGVPPHGRSAGNANCRIS